MLAQDFADAVSLKRGRPARHSKSTIPTEYKSEQAVTS